MSPKYFLWTVTDFVKIHKKSLIEKIKEDDRGVKNVQSDELTWHLIKAVQELSAKVTALEAG